MTVNFKPLDTVVGVGLIFLWMTHFMYYEGRDNFNTIVLRAFSVIGFITVLSGFLL